ncbi:MAG: hypothetical protein KF777_05280 [Planctomycetaceae bacterium]|nr:hypothetical protein [Planctomycetaceae bacterium]
MAIEFNCPHCDKFLSTSPDKAGRKAKCPGCGEVVTVPAGEGGGTVVDEGDWNADDQGLPAAKSRSCPMCGAKVSASDTVCEACGEELKPAVTRSSGPGRLNAAKAVEVTWKIYKEDMGTTIGLTILTGVLGLVAHLPAVALLMMAAFAVANGDDPSAYELVGNLLSLAGSIAYVYFLLGLQIALLKIARGQEVGVSDLFGGGKYFLRMVLALLLFMLAYLAGALLCLLPGIYVAIMLWPFVFVLIDEDAPGIDCLARSIELTRGNMMSSFAMFVNAIGIILLGYLACLVGIVIAAPMVGLLYAVSYLHLTGQRTALDVA